MAQTLLISPRGRSDLRTFGRSLTSAACLALMVGCGGGGGDTSSPAAPVDVTQTGVFSDAPVVGLRYATSSGLSGQTNALGEFRFKTGDTVSFSIGDTPLGSTTAAGVVTPLHLANGNESNRFTNLLVLLQSLDTDGNPNANGITLPASLNAAKLQAVVARLDEAPTAFATNLGNPDLAALSPTGQVVAAAAAAAHYALKHDTAFLDDAAGVWVQDGSFDQTVLRLGKSGRYALIEGAPKDNEGSPGVEYGLLYRDPATGVIAASNIGPDTNGKRGLSDVGTAVLKMTIAGSGKLTVDVREADGKTETVTFTRMEQVMSRIHGAWSTSADLTVSAPMFLFWPDGRFMQANAAVPDAQLACGGPGVEKGTVTWDGIPQVQSSDALSYGFVMNGMDVNSNGCAGLSGLMPAPAPAPPRLLVSGDGYTMWLAGPLDFSEFEVWRTHPSVAPPRTIQTFHRIKRPPV